MEWPTGTVTFVFTDIVGSTPLVHALGDRYLALLEEHNAIMRDAWRAHGGVEVKTEGDSFFVVFSDADAAIAAAAHAQRTLSEHRWHDGVSIKVRIGIHTGEASLVGRDYLGSSVNVAARVQAAAHGDQILLTQATLDAAALSDGLTVTELGSHGLKGVPGAVQLYQLTGAGLAAVFPPPITLRAVRHNLPTPPTELVGRAAIVDEIEATLLDDARVLTLVGPGGIGKTRLALEVAHDLLAYRPGGAYFVEAAPLTEDPELLPTIAAAMSIEAVAGRPLLAQIAAAASEPTLLVLDNLEHLPTAGAVVAELVATAPSIQVLATSRSRLRIRAERCIEVLPLATVAETETHRSDAPSPASALFLSRGSAIVGRRAWSNADLDVVTEVVERLDGVPLAIELAAARLADRSLSEIRDGLARATELLTEGDLDLPVRQRSMDAAIRWSLDLLPDSTRTLLGALSAFRGGASRDALEAVSGRAIDDDLVSLAAASLIRRDEEGRVRVLEPVRMVAEAEIDDAAAVEGAHVAWYLDLARRAWDGIAGPQQREWAARLRHEDPNLEAAIHRAAPDTALEIVANAGRVWGRTGKALRGAELVERSLDAASLAAPARARAWLVLGNLRRLLGQFQAADAALIESIRIAAASGDVETEHLATIQRGEVLRATGQADLAYGLLTSCVERIQEEAPRLTPMALQNLALTRLPVDASAALGLLRRAADAFLEQGDLEGHVRSLTNLASSAQDAGESETAQAAIAAAQHHIADLDDPRLIAQIHAVAGYVDFLRGDPASAEAHSRAAVELYEAVGDRDGVIAASRNLVTFIEADEDRRAEALEVAESNHALARATGRMSHLDALQAAYSALALGQAGRAVRIIAGEDLETGPHGSFLAVVLALGQARIGNEAGALDSLATAARLPDRETIGPDILSQVEAELGSERFAAIWNVSSDLTS